MNIEITKLNHTGEGIGKINNKIIFIEKSLPGDIIKIKEMINYKNYATAKIEKIIHPSPLRIKITCPYYNSCGGCQLLGLSYQEQLNYKKEKVANILKKYANLDTNLTISGIDENHYRNKITLQVKNNHLGLFNKSTNNLIEINKCQLITNRMNDLIPILKKLDLSNIKNIIIRNTKDEIMVILKGTISKKEVISVLKDKVSSIYINDNLIYGKKTITEKLGNYTYQISPNSFFQVNSTITEMLYNEILNATKQDKKILDLYCGMASIGIYISKNKERIDGIEINESSIKDAITNIDQNQLTNLTIKKGSVQDLIEKTNDYDTIIVDPPRSGLDKKTRKILKQKQSPKIIYISCNPITLARDLNDLKETYQVKEIKLFDMFKNTYHVECLCVLNYRNPL